MPFALALDIGKRRTGVAFGESASQMVMALDTINHRSIDELIAALKPIITQRKIEKIHVGLPLLLSGEDGSQSNFVRDSAKQIEKECGMPVSYIDERYSNQQHQSEPTGTDDNTRAACTILEVAFSQEKNGENR